MFKVKEKKKLELFHDLEPLSRFPVEDNAKVDERERLRCLGISKKNKENVLWNKGRKKMQERHTQTTTISTVDKECMSFCDIRRMVSSRGSLEIVRM